MKNAKKCDFCGKKMQCFVEKFYEVCITEYAFTVPRTLCYACPECKDRILSLRKEEGGDE